MGYLTALKIFGPIVLVAVIVGAFLALRAHDARETKIAHAFADCQSSAKPPIGAPGSRPVDQACPADLAHAVVTSRQAETCDQALTAANGFAVEQTCSGPVKRIVADRDAQAAMVADRDQAIARERADQAAALDRATARASAEATRKANATAAIHAAPLGADGLRVCDAQCLRQLGGAPPAAGGGQRSRRDDAGPDALGMPGRTDTASADRAGDSGRRNHQGERRRAELDRRPGRGAGLGPWAPGRRLARVRATDGRAAQFVTIAA